MEANYPRPLIDVDPYRENSWAATKFMLVRWGHKVEEIHDCYPAGLLRKFRVAPYVIAEHVERTFYGTPYDRVVRHNISLWGGSQWWILPKEVINYVVKKRQDDAALFREFSRTWTPDETFFQTMTMNSPLAHMVLKPADFLDYNDLRCMTYSNFITPTKSFRGHPHIINVEDFDRIMQKKQLFARKFDMRVDSVVMDRIDEMINR